MDIPNKVLGILWIPCVLSCLTMSSGCKRSAPGVDDDDGGPGGCLSDPRLCGEGGSCSRGRDCYGGICLENKPECAVEGYFFDGTADEAIEPNNCPELATLLQCGDPFGADYDPCACPPVPTSGGRRQSYQAGLQGVVICPVGDVDIYRFFLFAGETLAIHVIYRYNLGRDINLNILWENQPGIYEVVAQAVSTNDNENLAYTALTDGYAYIAVLPAYPEDVIDPNTGEVTYPADLNEYILQFALNLPGCNSNSVCEDYETFDSCPGDCASAPFCGNQVCEWGETQCPQDCFCGNGTCDVSVGENTGNCPDDCPQCS